MTFLKLITFYLKFSRPLLVFSMLVGLLAGVTSVVLVGLISRKVTDPQATTASYFGVFFSLVIVQLILTVVSGLLATHLAERTAFDLRLRLCRQIIAAPLRDLEEAGSHRMLGVLTQDIFNITIACAQLPQICISLAILLGCLIYLGSLSSLMISVLIACLVLAIVSVKLLEARAKRYMERARENWDALVRHVQVLTEGAKELKLHRRRRQSFFSEVIHSTISTIRHDNTLIGTTYSFINGWSMALYFIVVGLILYVLPTLDQSIDAYKLTSYAIAILYLRGYVAAVMSLLPTFNQAGVSLSKLKSLGLVLNPLDVDVDSTGEDDSTPQWEELELKGVTHSYYREKEDDNFILGPLDLTLNHGEIAFIIGGNGSGKTTLAKMLAGLYVPELGEIRLDGNLVNDENRDDYRQHFSVIFTDFYLFEQLLGLNHPNLDERARAYLAELQLDRKVKVKDGRLSTVNLSHGQRKRLALLTAYLEDRPIYVFDEWDSGQDPMFKEVFYRQLLPDLKARGKTVIVISHDDSHYQVADRLIKLDYGQVKFDKRMVGQLAELGSAPLSQ